MLSIDCIRLPSPSINITIIKIKNLQLFVILIYDNINSRVAWILVFMASEIIYHFILYSFIIGHVLTFSNCFGKLYKLSHMTFAGDTDRLQDFTNNSKGH